MKTRNDIFLGDTTEKMVIQVTQSDEDESKKPSKPSKSRSSHKDHQRRRKDDRNEAMEEDGEEETNNDVDHRYIISPFTSYIMCIFL